MPAELRLLITVGSGVERLSALQRIRIRTRGGLVLRASLALSWVYSYLACRGLYEALTHPHGLGYLLMIAVGNLFYAALFLAFGAGLEGKLHPGWWNLLKFRKIRWLDYFTADDPVPRGSPFNR